MCHIKALAFDRWRIEDIKRELDAIGCNVELVPFGQGFKDLSPAVDVLERLDLLRHAVLEHLEVRCGQVTDRHTLHRRIRVDAHEVRANAESGLIGGGRGRRLPCSLWLRGFSLAWRRRR